MRKGKLVNRILGIVLVLVMIGGMLGWLPALVGQVEASPATIYVPDNYPTIQAAVDAASPGDTIIVRDGTYTENVDVNKSLTICSENGAEKTIVQAANPNDHVFEVTGDYVDVSGFTIKGLRSTGLWPISGIHIDGANNCIITDNNITDNRCSISLRYANLNRIENNNLDYTGIYIWESSSGNNITGNHIIPSGLTLGTHYSIFLEYAGGNNNITRNIVSNKVGYGAIASVHTGINIIYLNSFLDNTYVWIHDSVITWNSPEEITYTYNGTTYTNYLGNYWSDYTGSDAEGNGIGDTPYPIDSDADNYPLVKPFESYVIEEPEGPPPEEVPTQPVNLLPADGATDVSLSPILKSSPPLQGVAKDSIPWEEFSEGIWVTRVDSQWRIATGQGDYSSPVWTSTLTDGLVARHLFPDLPDAWLNAVSGGLEYETTYYWQVRHRDFRGVWSPWSDETYFTTRAFRPPEARFTYSSETFRAGDKVELDARGSSPGESPIRYYFWDLTGDGKANGVTTSPMLYYFWDKGGIYAVTLTVMNWGEDTHSTTQHITIEELGWWERTVVAWWRRVFGSDEPSQEELNRFETIKRELRLSEDERFYDPGTSERERDYQIMVALKEEVPEEGGITYEQLILQVLHDMELVDFYVSAEGPPINPVIEAWFTNMADVNLWAEAGLKAGGASLVHIVKAAGSTMNGLGVGLILDLPVVMQGIITSRALVTMLHDLQRWFFFKGMDDPDWFKMRPEEREYLVKLRDEYAGPLSGSGRQNFKEGVRENLRKILYYVFEPYKSWPVHTYQINSPVELRVYDSEGNLTGVTEGEISEEIEGSVYVDGSVLIYPTAGSYYFDLVGTDEGSYWVTVTNVSEGEDLGFAASDIPTLAGAIHRFTIDWDALAQGEDGVTVQVDSDGDGAFERTITGGSELTGEDFIPKVEVVVTIDPETLNLQARGKWITAYIELPDEYAVDAIDIGTVQLLYDGSELDADWEYVQDGVFMAKFDRATVAGWFEGLHDEEVELTVAGEVNGIQFEGTGTIRIIDPPPPGRGR